MNYNDFRSTKNTKIALVANSTWNIYNFRLNLVKALEKNGAEVVVIAPVDEYIHYLNKASRIKHIPLKSLSRKTRNPFRDLLLFWELYRIYFKEKPDVVIHYTIKPNIFGNLAAFFNKIVSICVVTGLGYTFLNEGWTKKISNLLYRISFRVAKRIIFENKDDRALFIKDKLVKEAYSLSVNGCGVDTTYFRPVAKKRQQDKFVFLFVGRLLYDKGIVEFVTAARKVAKTNPDAEFWVVGELDAGNPSAIRKGQLLNWVDQKYIYYHGTTTNIRSFLKKADAVVLPSYREGLPKVILEAMAMAKPVITTYTAGCKETVDENVNGFLVPIRDSDQLANAMQRLLALEPIDLEIMGRIGRKKAVEQFDAQLIATEYISIINRLLPKSKHIGRRKSPAVAHAEAVSREDRNEH